jgi:hypothetical protein
MDAAASSLAPDPLHAASVVLSSASLDYTIEQGIIHPLTEDFLRIFADTKV